MVYNPSTGIARVNGALAVSRSFGDRRLKEFITAQPEITMRVLEPGDDFVIVASDGEQTAIERCRPALTPDESAQIVMELHLLEPGDDCTIFVECQYRFKTYETRIQALLLIYLNIFLLILVTYPYTSEPY